MIKMPEARFVQNDIWWRYEPKEDITPYEVALLLPAFIYTTKEMNLHGYLEMHNLMRHFVEEVE